MQRQALLSLATALTLVTTGTFAQSGELRGVTMRVLDNLDDIETVVLSLDASRTAGEQGTDAGRAEPEEAADDAEAERERPSPDAAEGERQAERRSRDELHDTDVDERSEGRLEDRDVAQRPVAAPTTP